MSCHGFAVHPFNGQSNAGHFLGVCNLITGFLELSDNSSDYVNRIMLYALSGNSTSGVRSKQMANETHPKNKEV